MKIGIIGAMPEEVDSLKNEISNVKTTEISGMTFYEGVLGEKKVVVVQCGMGKVNAGVCAHTLINMNEIERREVNEAIDAADDAIYHLKSARRCLDSAGTWGILDIFGGNMITGLLKHSKMASAEREIDDARYALQKFSKELRDVRGFSSIHIDEFLTFADFFFDGFVMDVIVQSKISTAKKQCDDAIRQVESIKKKLVVI